MTRPTRPRGTSWMLWALISLLGFVDAVTGYAKHTSRLAGLAVGVAFGLYAYYRYHGGRWRIFILPGCAVTSLFFLGGMAALAVVTRPVL